MSRGGRKLTPQEAALWAKVAKTVAPLEAHSRGTGDRPDSSEAESPASPLPKQVAGSALPRRPVQPATDRASISPSPRSVEDRTAHTLDASWDRKLGRGIVHPDFTLDLHGATLDIAYTRLMHGLGQAKAMGARVVLLVTGKPRPVDPADRGQRRGAIRNKVMDWLAHSEHAGDIAAIRNAHRRHGGQGALYIVLKKRRG